MRGVFAGVCGIYSVIRAYTRTGAHRANAAFWSMHHETVRAMRQSALTLTRAVRRTIATGRDATYAFIKATNEAAAAARPRIVTVEGAAVPAFARLL